MKRPSGLNLNNMIFSLFWWVIQKISPQKGEKLMYWGLESGAFPNRSKEDPILSMDFLGMHFNTPVGIASSFDKKVGIVDDLIFMGAGFGEMGPYTLENESPVTETFFLPKDRAIVTQSLGFKNFGIINMVPAFINRRYLPNIVGISITSTAESEEENVKQGRIMTYNEEFDMMVRKIAPYCDFLTVDFSHPEVEMSRVISDGATVIPLLRTVQKAAEEAAPIHKPKIFVKLPLNLTPMELPMVCHHMLEAKVDAVIVGGPFSLSHERLKLSKNLYAGMLTGAPVKRYVIDMIGKVHQFSKGKLPVIACGGIFNGRDAYDCLAAGASLIQLDTVLRYEGPGAVTKINRELATLLRRKGLDNVSKAIGIDFY